jgi:outer membrane immunogenic protein
MMTKAFLLATAVVLSIGSAASAADLTPAPVLPVPAVFSWTGPYLGLAAGYAWGHVDIQTPGAGHGELDPNGWLVGGFAGYSYQLPSGVVLGAEADLEWTGLSDDGSKAGFDFSADMNWDASIRSRIGYAFNRALIYGTGGLAFAGVDGEVDPGSDSSDTEWGWTIGAGLDYAFTDRIFGRAEYRFAYLYGSDDDAGDIGDFTTNAVRVGVGVKF